MASPNPVLLVTDFSDHARHAAERAAWVAEEAGAALILMHVIPEGRVEETRRSPDAAPAAETALHDDARTRLKQLASEIGATRAVTIQTVHTIGSVLEDILVQASTCEPALIVLGARGTGSLRRLVLGTTSERLLNRSTRPLLVVRRPPPGPYRRVLVALDFSPWSEDLVALARQVAPTAHLVLLHAIQMPVANARSAKGIDVADADRPRFDERAAAAEHIANIATAAGLDGGAYEARIVEGDAPQVILEQERDCDLVVMGKQGRSAVKDFLLGSVSRRVLTEGTIDVVISTASGSSTSTR